MLIPLRRTLARTTAARPAWQLRLLRIAFFVILTAFAARFRIDLPDNPVPITGQVLAVLLAGLALGAQEGAVSVIAYLGLVAVGVPLDARGVGAAALVGPTAGYLFAFVPAAFIAGLFTGRVGRWSLTLNLIAALTGAALIHVIGTFGVAVTGRLPWSAAALLGSAPFILLDFGKALLAVALVRLGKESLVRWG